MFRIVIAADDLLVRVRLARLVSSEPGLTVVGHAGSAAATLGLVRRSGADAVLVDLTVASSGTLDLIAAVRRDLPGVFIVAVLADAAQGTVREAFDAGASASLQLEDLSRGGPEGWTVVLPPGSGEPSQHERTSFASLTRDGDPPAGRAGRSCRSADQDRRTGLPAGRQGRFPHGCV